MKLTFNDATEIGVQQVRTYGDYLNILTTGNTPEQLKVLFTDPTRTAHMVVEERGQIIGEYDGYTAFYRTECYTGQIYGVTMYKPETLPEVQTEIQQAAVAVARIQAQELTDEQALTVKAIYPAWSGESVSYAADYKVLHEDVLYKCLQAHTSQAGWEPGVAPSLWAAVDAGTSAGTLEDPIPVPDTVTMAGMEYEKGKYYSENGTVYLMNRGGMAEGEKVILYFAPSALVGQYFEVAATE